LGFPPSHTQLDWHHIIFKMLTIKGIYGREIFKTWYQVMHLLQSGLDVFPIITHRFLATEYQKGFDAMLQGSCGKVILDWTHL
jgi:threonine 3-dehydrogenase